MSCFHFLIRFKVHRCLESNTSLPWVLSQSCLTLCDPRDCSLPFSSVHGPRPKWEKKDNFNHVIRYIDKYRYIEYIGIDYFCSMGTYHTTLRIRLYEVIIQWI